MPSEAATAAGRKFKVLTAKKEALFSIIQTLSDLSKSLKSESEKQRFKVLYKSLDSTKTEFINVVEEINVAGLEMDENFNPDFKVLRTVFELCCYIQSAADKLKNETGASASGSNNDPHSAFLNLPKTELPDFSGELRQWPIFYSIFKTKVHENMCIKDSDKVTFLVSHLQGPALSVCSGIAPTADNYETIWKRLIEKYEDKQALARSYLDQMLDFKPLINESSKNLNIFLEKFDAAVCALKNLGISDLADFIIVYLALSKLDMDTAREFKMHNRSSSNFPTYKSLIKFVQEQAKIIGTTVAPSTSKQRTLNKSFVINEVHKSNEKTELNSCIFCHKSNHFVSKCNKFLSLTPNKRYEVTRNNRWCFLCLSGNHGVRICRSKSVCRECGKKHNTLLHLGRLNVQKEAETMETALEGVSNSETTTEKTAKENSNSVYNLFSEKSESSTILLSTAVVNVVNSSQGIRKARFLLDSGSQANLLTLKCCRTLGLSVKRCNSSVQGFGSSTCKVKGETEIVLGSRHKSDNKIVVKTLVVDKITDSLPKVEVDINFFPELRTIPLADNDFNKPNDIDGILGAEIYFDLIGDKRILGPKGFPVAVETVFGFIVMGRMPIIQNSVQNYKVFLTLEEELCIESHLRKFWELEQVPSRQCYNPEEQECEKIFLNSFSRDQKTGRFTVALPFKQSPEILGESKMMAMRRLFALERRLARSSDMRVEYNKVMEDFMNQGHMKLIDNTISNFAVYYIPHHAVVKQDSISTPIRVVLDASASTDTGLSLNDILFSGPKLQIDICSLLLNFRIFKIALTADIRQMYRQINLTTDHTRFQRILWRFNPDEEVKIYEIVTVAFGVKSSPFLALRTVKQLAKEEKENFPMAVEFINKYLYMDDLVCSIETEDKAYALYNESVNFFEAGKFDLTKWSTNSPTIISRIPVEKRLSKDVVFKTDTKILGMKWDPETDIFYFEMCKPVAKCTKRIILSVVAKCYDPLGLIAPVIFHLKLLIKEMWKLKIDWDEDPPKHIQKLWLEVVKDWEYLSVIKIPRHLKITTKATVSLLAFADASQNGYGSVIYARTSTEMGEVFVHLVCAKSKISPFKNVTIPRLELCAALLLSKLLRYILEIFQQRISVFKVWAFSDSKTVLQWLATSYIKDVFVGNRIAQIRENLCSNLPEVLWGHVGGLNNPADCLSRGLLPSEVLNHPMWLTGPDWIKDSQSNWPVKIFEINRVNRISEENESVFVATAESTHPIFELIERCSSWMFLLRVTVRILKFLKILPTNKLISVSDLCKAEMKLIKVIQRKHFGSDISLLSKRQECSSRLRKMRPFLENDILRVGGRLQNANLRFSQQHPIILPGKDSFTDILIDFYHRINLHTGPHLLEAILRQKYWIVGGSNLIRKRIRLCNHCFRLCPKNANPLMGNLPSPRVQPSKVFLHTGVDYFGPFNITLGKKRGGPVCKAYVCLFVCMSVKAVHLELVSSLSTPHFLQAFKRFISRRGPCKILYSDQGSNFIGAKRILKELNEFMKAPEFHEQMVSQLATQGVEWKFNSPAAPHMGGLWESNVKSVKNHIWRVLGTQLLTYEEFNSLLTQIESLLNSRPLCRLSNDSSAPEALTPAHFLTLTPLKVLPFEDLTEVKMNRLDRFQLIDRMVQDFWKRWRLEYLTSLQIRQKWNRKVENVEIGSPVILKLDNCPPLHWPLGVITEVYPGSDGIVRNIKVKTAQSSFIRPVVKVCPLPNQ